MENIAHAVLSYGPFNIPVDLHGFPVDAEGNRLDESYEGVGHQYRYGVIRVPDGLKEAQVADWRVDLLALANGPYAFGVETLYFPDEVPDDEMPEEGKAE